MSKKNGHPPAQGQANAPKPPAVEFRIGRIRATVWENNHPEKGKWFSITLTRSYKDDQGRWKTASSFGRDDLLVVGEVCRMAFHWVNREYGGGQRDPLQLDAGQYQEESDAAPGEDVSF
jgi:hypothetical protein